MKFIDGKVLAQLRAYVKQSQTDIGAILNISQHKVSRMEIGKQDMPKDWFDKLIEHYHIPESWVKAHLFEKEEERDYEISLLRNEVSMLKGRLEDKEEIIAILKESLEQYSRSFASSKEAPPDNRGDA